MASYATIGETIEALAVPDLVASVLPLVCRFEALAVPGLAASVLHLVCRFEALKVLDLAASVLPLVCRFEALEVLDLATSVLPLVCRFSDTSLAPAVSFTHWSPPDHFPVFTGLSINPAPSNPATSSTHSPFPLPLPLTSQFSLLPPANLHKCTGSRPITVQ